MHTITTQLTTPSGSNIRVVQHFVQGRHVALGIYPPEEKVMPNPEPNITPAPIAAIVPGARVLYHQPHANGYTPTTGLVTTLPVKNSLDQYVYNFQPDGKKTVWALASYTELIDHVETLPSKPL